MIVLLPETPAVQNVHLATDCLQYPQNRRLPQRLSGYNHGMHNEVQADEIAAELAHKALWVRYGDRAFARLSTAILSEARVAEADEHSVHEIMLVKASAHPIPQPSRLRDRLWLVGCGIVTCAVLSVLAIGGITIYQWLR
jgi:hypothetical protein